MNTLNDIIGDLRERRMWPLLVLFAVIAIAAPFVLSGGADEGGQAVAGSPGQTPEGSASAVRPVAATGRALERNTKSRKDPFYRPPAPPEITGGAEDSGVFTGPGFPGSVPNGGDETVEAPTDESVPEITSPGGVPTSPVGGDPTGDSDPTSGGVPAGDSGPTADPGPPSDTVVWVTGVRTGPVGDTRTIGNVARLSPLPSVARPLVVLLGVEQPADGPRAAFLVSASVQVSGDGECLPKQDQCESLTLREGETATLTSTSPDGTKQEDVVKILWLKQRAERNRSTESRESRAGRRLLKDEEAWLNRQAALDRWTYFPAQGLLIARPSDALTKSDDGRRGGEQTLQDDDARTAPTGSGG